MRMVGVDFPDVRSPWIKMWGATAAVLGFYYIWNADSPRFALGTVIGRPLIFCLMLLAGLPQSMAMFGAMDLVGAAWTYYALKQEGDYGSGQWFAKKSGAKKK